jgi:bacterioferritin-associated ferredoxin
MRADDVARHSQLSYISDAEAPEARMYICLCNGLTDRDVRAQCSDGYSVSMVYRGLGCEAQCGKCVPFVLQILRQNAASAEAETGGDD